MKKKAIHVLRGYDLNILCLRLYSVVEIIDVYQRKKITQMLIQNSTCINDKNCLTKQTKIWTQLLKTSIVFVNLKFSGCEMSYF